jgi:hypothetical protein
MAKEHKIEPEEEIKASHSHDEHIVEHEEPKDVEASLNDSAEPADENPAQPNPGIKTEGKKHWFKDFARTKKGKIILAVSAAVLVIALVFAIPASRYAVAGLVIKKDLNVSVVDSETGKPVSAVQLMVQGQTAKTDAKGKATFHVPVGQWRVSTKKTYYKDADGTTLVPILSNQTPVQIAIDATGRQVPVTITNRISGAALAGVEITAGASVVTTADDGQATIILPADKTTVNATFKLDKFNNKMPKMALRSPLPAKSTF